MARHWSRRVAAAFFAIWLSLVGLEGTLLPCPMHQATSHAAASRAAAGHDHHATPPSHGSHRCSCPGSCCGSPVGVPTGFPLDFAAVLSVTASLPQSPLVRLAIRADFILPFATAPPAVSLA